MWYLFYEILRKRAQYVYNTNQTTLKLFSHEKYIMVSRSYLYCSMAFGNA